jgi:1-phosphofructokinase family hexose kinase
MGGKGTCCAWVLGALGYHPLALGFAAGRTGDRLEEMLRRRGVVTDFVSCGGETRIAVVIVCEFSGTQCTITSNTLEVNQEHVAELDRRVRQALHGASCLVLGGSMPLSVSPGLYVDWMRLARAREIPSILDASGSTLRGSLQGGPTILKPNEDEVEQVLGWRPTTWGQTHAAARELMEAGAETVVITRGAEGAMAVSDDEAYVLHPLPISAVNTAGAGDALTAGLAVSLSQGRPLVEGLRLGGAAAAAVCLTEATADCHAEDVDRLVDDVRVERWQPC